MTPTSGGRLESLLVSIREPFENRAETSSASSGWILLFRLLSLPALLVGREHRFAARAGGQSLDVACVGFLRRFTALIEELFEDVEYRESTRLRFLPRARALQEMADVVLVDVHASFIRSFRRAGWLIVPETVRWSGPATDLPPADPGKSLKEDIRKIRRAGYSFEEAGTAEDWDEFMDRMLIPHLRRRFGEHARVPGPGARRGLRAKASLFFVVADGVRVAGGCMLRSPRGVVFKRLGVRGGDEDLLRDGAVTALFLFLFQWARDEGFDEFDAGPTLALPASGLARFKAKLGLRAGVDPGALTTGIHYDRQNTAARAVFERQPVFHLVDDGMGIHP